MLPLTNQPGRHGDRRYRRERYEFAAGVGVIPEAVAPNLRNRGWRIIAEIDPGAHAVEGVIACHGSAAAGYALYVQDGRLHYVNNFVGTTLTTVSATVGVPPGTTRLRCEFVPTGPFAGDVKLFYGDEQVAEGHVPRTTPITYGMAGFSVGYQRGSAVTPAYEPPFTFTEHALRRVIVEPEGAPWRNPSAEERAAVAMQ